MALGWLFCTAVTQCMLGGGELVPCMPFAATLSNSIVGHKVNVLAAAAGRQGAGVALQSLSRVTEMVPPFYKAAIAHRQAT